MITIEIQLDGSTVLAKMNVGSIDKEGRGETIAEAVATICRQIYLERKGILGRNEFVYPITSPEAEFIEETGEYKW
jgi:hypothetical protein